MPNLRQFILPAAMMVGAIFAPPASAAVILSPCDSVTDGDSDGCLFKGNINGTDPMNKHSYKNVEAAYNELMDPDITLNWITKTDDGDFGDFGSFTGLGQNTGTFSLPDWELEYFAVKAGNEFMLYEYIGGSTWTTAGQQGMSHVAFFGTPNTPGVPEPSTWAMLILGFGFVGGAMRLAKRRETSSLTFA